jgi:hypothetical protein
MAMYIMIKKMENCKCAMTKYSWYHETKFCIITSKESVKSQNTKHQIPQNGNESGSLRILQIWFLININDCFGRAKG